MKFKSKEEIDSSYRSWLTEMKERLNGHGPYFLGLKTPFFSNAEFRPKPIISNNIRSQVYGLHKKDPKYWTVLRLSSKFSINSSRVESIIRQKTYEDCIKISELNREYVGKMESHLLIARQSVQIKESDTTVKDREPRPMLLAVPENYSLTLKVLLKFD